jgi:hypothetical protein
MLEEGEKDERDERACQHYAKQDQIQESEGLSGACANVFQAARKKRLRSRRGGTEGFASQGKRNEIDSVRQIICLLRNVAESGDVLDGKQEGVRHENQHKISGERYVSRSKRHR